MKENDINYKFLNKILYKIKVIKYFQVFNHQISRKCIKQTADYSKIKIDKKTFLESCLEFQ
jgi:hypothetical protein